ncbi:transcription factor TGA2.3-like [Lycium barbarum]|uniref:transcription factor TGA2.3-like n=1 Tax=Lycium barbarum TaxID=112863 RepID=UPI00293E96FF|nr:transcription factor TGA2.3-like [Lycium barbarum]
MQAFKAAVVPAVTLNNNNNSNMYCHSNYYLRNDEASRHAARFADIGELEQSAGFTQEDTVDLSRSSLYGEMRPNNVGVVSCNNNNNLHFGELNTSIGSSETGVDNTGGFMLQHKAQTAMAGGGVVGGGALGNVQHFEKWGDSGIADHSQQTDTSTDVDTDERNHQSQGVQHGALIAVDSIDQSKVKLGDQKTLRRLAQNREAARKSRLRKKAYVQQLENSRFRLSQLEQELKRARQQGIFIANGYTGDQSLSAGGNGALAFDMDYARWLEEHQRHISDLRSAVNSHRGDNELRHLVDGVMSHYDEIFKLKSIGAKSDVFHMLSGMWKTPAERCFMWLGGFRSSELLKILGNHLEPLTEQQLMGICNLQQSSQQAEDALSQGMEALQQSLVDTLSSTSLGPTGSGNVADYMGQMAIAMGKLATLENFLYQADLLRQQTLQQLHRILTTRQAARALLVISDYMSRLRALSSLWLARPKDQL